MKFYIEPSGDLGVDEEVILNPIMKDLIINGYVDEHHMQAFKRKRSKR